MLDTASLAAQLAAGDTAARAAALDVLETAEAQQVSMVDALVLGPALTAAVATEAEAPTFQRAALRLALLVHDALAEGQLYPAAGQEPAPAGQGPIPLVRACFSWEGKHQPTRDGWAEGTAVAAVLRKAPAELVPEDALTFALSCVTEAVFPPCAVHGLDVLADALQISSPAKTFEVWFKPVRRGGSNTRSFLFMHCLSLCFTSLTEDRCMQSADGFLYRSESRRIEGFAGRMVSLLLDLLRPPAPGKCPGGGRQRLPPHGVTLVWQAAALLVWGTSGPGSAAAVALEAGVHALGLAGLREIGSPADWVSISRGALSARGPSNPLRGHQLPPMPCLLVFTGTLTWRLGERRERPGSAHLEPGLRAARRRAGRRSGECVSALELEPGPPAAAAGRTSHPLHHCLSLMQFCGSYARMRSRCLL